jgi:cellulose biosynthesis protein BcsQ
MRVVAIFNIKGGVGKTAAAVNLAFASAAGGYRTLLWDIDPQGAASFYFRIKPKLKGGEDAIVRPRHPLERYVKGSDFANLDLLPADFSLRYLDLALERLSHPRRRIAERIEELARRYDLALIDCAPGMSLASESVIEACDALLVPVVPTTLSVRSYERLRRFVRKHGGHPPLLAFFSLVDVRKRMHREIMEALWSSDAAFMRSWIPTSSDVERMGEHRAPVASYAPGSRAAHAYQELWQEFDVRLAVVTAAEVRSLGD